MCTTREAIKKLFAGGMRQPEIARQLDLAPSTVTYHVERILRGESSTREAASPEPAVQPSRTRAAVARLLADGCTRVEIARRLGISKPTVTYHARRLGGSIDSRCARRYDWAAVQRYYDEGHSVRECVTVFGFSSSSWFDAVQRGALTARPSATPMPELLVAGTYRCRNNVKIRLIKEGLKANCCERCGLSRWRGEPITMALHHINGDRLDNRLENLQLLCPNCHSQTDTFSGRNGRRAAK